MVRRTLFILGLSLLNSCGGHTRLQDGITTVPFEGYIFKNKKNFNSIIFEKFINSKTLYQLESRYYADENFNKIREVSPLGAYFIQFYDNGCVRGMDYLEPNPNIAGYRAIIYQKNQNIWIDRAGLSSDRSLKIYTYKLKIEGDKIYLLEIPKTLFKPSEYTCLVYEKSKKIPDDWKQYKPAW